MSFDWSNVRRDADGDWATVSGATPAEAPVFNSNIPRSEWLDLAAFATAVALAMDAEDQERRLWNERLYAHVAAALNGSTLIPNSMAELAIGAVREFEKENPVD